MTFRYIRVDELEIFIRSDWYTRLPVIPITPQRAHSQTLNPHAQPGDTALILALDEEENLLGFIGILPASFHVPGEERCFFISGWWVDPVKGSQAGMPLFFKMLTLTGNRMIFVEPTSHTEQILQGLGRFHIQDPMPGMLLWFRSRLTSRAFRKNGSTLILLPFFCIADIFLNGFQALRIYAWKRKMHPGSMQFEEFSLPNQEVSDFIDRVTENVPVCRKAFELDWVLKNQWLVQGKGKTDIRYPFSWYARRFEQKLWTFRKNGVLVGVAMVTFRDGMMKVPYLYGQSAEKSEVAAQLLYRLSCSRGHGLFTWNPVVISALSETGFPVLFAKKVRKRNGYSSVFEPVFNGYMELQDGDGDAVFT